MSTFTFITALFLPGTFLATFLSITMIDWLPESPSSGRNGGSSNGSTQVSKYYWVFWAIDVPLTVFVMLGWWAWFRHAKRTWVKENGIMLNRDESKASISRSSTSSRSPSRGKRRSVLSLNSMLIKDEERRSPRTLSIRELEDGNDNEERDGSLRMRHGPPNPSAPRHAPPNLPVLR